MSIERRIYNKFRTGTANNPGVPEPLASIMLAQAKHESGNFSSNIFRTCNNAFGYKFHNDEPACTQSPEGNAYAYYSSPEQSAGELVDYVYRRVRQSGWPDLSRITTPEQYAQLLKSAGYYGDSYSNYANALRRLYKQVEESPATPWFGLALLAGAIYLISKKGLL